jgi:hypothetical protein
MFGRFDARLRCLEALSPERPWLHERGLVSLWAYARPRPLPWDMPDLDAENEVIGLAALLQEARAWQVSSSVQKLEHGSPMLTLIDNMNI